MSDVPCVFEPGKMQKRLDPFEWTDLWRRAQEQLKQPRLDMLKRLFAEHHFDKGNQRTPGTAEVCAKCRASSSVQIVPEYGVGHHIEACMETDCPLKQVTNEKA